MRPQALLSLFTCIALLTGCTPAKASVDSQPETVETATEHLISTTDKENCYLCGSNRPSILDYYKKTNSIVLLCLNTWSVGDTRLYEYDDNGNLAENPKHSGTLIDSHGENECSWMVSYNPTRHNATVTLSYGENSVINPETLAGQLCQDCLDKVSDALFWDYKDNDWTYHCDIFMDTETDELYGISSRTVSCYLDDFWLHIDHDRDNNTDTAYLVYNPN
jgi:hypothetical protein